MKKQDQALQRLNMHWAVQAISRKDMKRAEEVATSRLVGQALDGCMTLAFVRQTSDNELIRRVSLAYEIAAIEGWNAAVHPTSGDDTLRKQFHLGASKAFEYRRLEPIPQEAELRILHILNLASLAYCGERWPDLKRWFKENESATAAPSLANVSWDSRLLYRLFDCWVRLFRKKDWNELDGVRAIVAGLRRDQQEYEPEVLDNGNNAEDRAMAMRLVAFYHWAKATDILAVYMLQGRPKGDVQSHLDKHFEAAGKAAQACVDQPLEMLLHWLHAAARQMVSGSLWWVARSVNSKVTKFVDTLTSTRNLFELLPPQQVALQEQGLLDIATKAVVVDMPTSGGKTLLAQFRILQTLNQFASDGGWVAYVVPTRALAAQITRTLRRDFEPLGLKVEQLTSALDIDLFEDALLKTNSEEKRFDILIATPEKLQLVIRNKKVPRPLHLLVMDEAHNIEDKSRGLRIELLLATIKSEYQDQVSFMLLMPYVENPETLARWLAGDAKSGRTISLSATPWKPNERIVGLYHKVSDKAVAGGWRLEFETLTTTPNTIHLQGRHRVGGIKPIKVADNEANPLVQTAAMASIMSNRPSKSTSVAIVRSPTDAWRMARRIYKSFLAYNNTLFAEKEALPREIEVVQRFLETECGKDYELIKMLRFRIGVHHANLSEETRALMEWLAEAGHLRVLCATSTITQGINFPVGSVFLSSCYVGGRKSKGRVLTPREFWNLAGRAGRVGHDSVGVVGIAAGDNPKVPTELVRQATGALVSRIVQLLKDLENNGRLADLGTVILSEEWEDFRCYIAHLLHEKKNLDDVIGDMEIQLRNTFGFGTLRSDPSSQKKADALLGAAKEYATRISKNRGLVAKADSTGFSVEGVASAYHGINNLERNLTPADWTPSSLFAKGKDLSSLVGVMFKVNQISEPLREIGGEGWDNKKIASIIQDWVAGKRIDEIAHKHFADGSQDESMTSAVDTACKAIYRAIANSGTWGISALSKISLDFDNLSNEEARQINALPAMMYHGVKTEEAVLMRMNQVPRSIAEQLGHAFRKEVGSHWDDANVQEARQFLQDLDADDWSKHRPKKAKMSGNDYREVWQILSGEKEW